jgi:hypothetical protein
MPIQTDDCQTRLRTDDTTQVRTRTLGSSPRTPTHPRRRAVPSTVNGSTLTWVTPSDRSQANPTFRFSSQVKVASSVLVSTTNRDNSVICLVCADADPAFQTVTLCDMAGGVVWKSERTAAPLIPSSSSDGKYFVCFLDSSDQAWIVDIDQPNYKPRTLTGINGSDKGHGSSVTIGCDGKRLAIARPVPLSQTTSPLVGTLPKTKIARDSNSYLRITTELSSLVLAFTPGDRFLVLMGQIRQNNRSTALSSKNVFLISWETTTLSTVYTTWVNGSENVSILGPVGFYGLSWSNNPAILLRMHPQHTAFTSEGHSRIYLANKLIKFSIQVKEQILAVFCKKILSVTADGYLRALEGPESGAEAVEVVVGKLEGERPDLYTIKAIALSEHLVNWL